MPIDLHSKEGLSLKEKMVEELNAFATKHNGQPMPSMGNHWGGFEVSMGDNSLPVILFAMLKKMESMQIEIDYLRKWAP